MDLAGFGRRTPEAPPGDVHVDLEAAAHAGRAGIPVRDAQGALTGYRGTALDVTESHDARERLEYLATRDILTGLALVRLDRATTQRVDIYGPALLETANLTSAYVDQETGVRGYAASVSARPGESPCANPSRCSEAELDLPAGVEGGQLQLRQLPEGVDYLNVVAVSGSGLASAPSSVPIHVDGSAPAVRFAGVPGGWVDHPVTVTAVAEDPYSGMAPAGPNGPFTALAIDGGVPTLSLGDNAAATVSGEGTHLVSGWARDALGKNGEAVVAYRTAVRLKPSDAGYRLNLGAALRRTGDLPGAVAALKDATRLSPRDPVAFWYHSALALGHLTQGTYDDAVRWSNRAYQENPRYLANLRFLIVSLAATGRVQEAEELGRRHMVLDPLFRASAFANGYAYRDPERRRWLGETLLKAGLPP